MYINIESNRISAEKDSFGGEYYTFCTDKAQITYSEAVARLESVERFVCSYLPDPFFLSPFCGDCTDKIPPETEWLGVKYADGTYSVLIPLVADGYRTCFSGKDGFLFIDSDCGDESVKNIRFRAFYHIHGDDVHELMDKAAESISEVFGITLAKDKKLPDFAKYFGWCTWDAFYERVSEEDVKNGLEDFCKNGFVPKLVILDDGWQDVTEYGMHRGNHLLNSFMPNAKFNGDLAPLSKMMKERYGVGYFLVWHAVGGYWGGASPFSESMSKYSPRFDAALVTKGMFENNLKRSYSECFPFGLVEDFDSFYNHYHKMLSNMGVDGVKIDVQSIIASHGRANGGREAITKKMRNALEKSVNANFNGNVISCMANTNEIVFNTSDTNMMRTSGDFSPSSDESSFRHIFANAVNSFFIGEFSACDWDMFWSNNKFGEYHAMARAISGGPAYVSDKPGEHNYDVIKRLTANDGSLFMCKEQARITAESLFADFEKADIPLIVENKNVKNRVLGAFSPSNTEKTGFEVTVGENEVLHSFSGKNICFATVLRAELLPCGSDIYTVAEKINGFAALGLVEKYNGGAAVLDYGSDGMKAFATVSDGGKHLVWSEKSIKRVFENEKEIARELPCGFNEINVPEAGTIEFEF